MNVDRAALDHGGVGSLRSVLGGKADWLQAPQRYPPGVTLFGQGEVLSAVWYIVSGTVKMTYVDTSRESIVGFALATDWVGTASVVVDRSAPVSAVTCSPALLARCPATTFRQLLRDDSALSVEIHKAHAHELCQQATRIGQLCLLDSRGRLCAELYRFAVAGESAVTTRRSFRLDLPLHRWELAEFIAVSTEHLSRLFHDIESEGLIRREKGWIVIDDLQRLHRATEVGG